MKRLLFLVAIIIGGTALVCGADLLYIYCSSPGESNTASACPPPQKLIPLPDADVLAARMPRYQEMYRKVCDETLAAYNKLHPDPYHDNKDARAALRLIAYLNIWGDFYGEGLWRKLSAHADSLLREGNRDLAWQAVWDINLYKDRHSSTDSDASHVTMDMQGFASEGYSAVLQLAADEMAMKNLVTTQHDPDIKLGSSYEALPDLASRAITQYRRLVHDHSPPDFLYAAGSTLLKSVEDDETTLTAIWRGIDQIFATEDKADPAVDALNAQFYVDDAWYARGSDYAPTVSDAGWQLFSQRLDEATAILNRLEAQHPGEWMTADAMMPVVLGQQQPRENMELWFQRGTKARPDSFAMYMAKRWYLLPRWYGTDDDEWQFGLQCANSDNWAAKIPMMLVECLSDAGERDPSIYARAAIWTPLEKVYRAYLQRFPDSVSYRSRFAKSAAQGGHWEIAKKQFKVLGDEWDRTIFSNEEYAAMAKEAAAH